MENAVKALYIAAGVLMAVMVLSLAAVLYSSLQSYVEDTNKQIQYTQVDSFNTEYLNYVNSNDGKVLTIQDVISAASSAYENNYNKNPDTSQWKAGPSTLYVQVLLNGRRIDQTINENMVSLLERNKDTKFSCKASDVLIGDSTGQVYGINFTEIH